MVISNATIAANSNKTIVVNSDGTDTEFGGYVFRGGATAFDWVETGLTADSAYHTLNLSAIIPANAKLVHFRVQIKHASVGQDVRICKVGLTT